MRVKLLASIIILFSSSCKSYFNEIGSINSNAVIIKKDNIESVIFSKEADCFLCNLGENRFTPTLQEINEAEEILEKNIRFINNPMYDQGEGCPIIHKNLNNYRRQYYGFIDKAGNKVLYVNFMWARYSIFDWLKGNYKDRSEEWKTQRVMVLDGCSNYWSIEISLTEQKLQNLYINGSA